jgi:alkyl hydroperoxide reductase subunit D
MTIEQLKDQLPDYAKDTRLNLGSVISAEGAPDLNINQIFGIALSSAYATKSKALIEAVKATVSGTLSEAELNAAKAAATIMGMNNIYYRFVHLAGDAEYKTMPAKLRMNVIGAPGIPKIDFELYSLAVSAINGCGMCIEAHNHEVLKAGITKLGVQSTIRIAAVVNSAAQAEFISSL